MRKRLVAALTLLLILIPACGISQEKAAAGAPVVVQETKPIAYQEKSLTAPPIQLTPAQVEYLKVIIYLEAVAKYEAYLIQKWTPIARCESHENWHIDGQFDGGLQFMPDTWRRAGGRTYAEYAYQATPIQQMTIADIWWHRIAAENGNNPYIAWAQWPKCSRQVGYR